MNAFGLKALATAALIVGLVGQAHAVWTFTSGTAASNNTSGTTPNVTSVSGAYITNGSNNAGFASNWTTSALSYYSPGVGMSTDSTVAPQHALDNSGRTEAMLIGFSSSVVLSSIGLSYTHNGTTQGASVDLSVFRYVGTGTPSMANATVTGGAMAGWELVGNYGDMLEDTSNPFNLVNSSGLGSSWWLISAYNSGFSGAKETRGALDNGNDYFKVYALAGSTCTSTVNGVCTPSRGTVPEPASLALASVALLGIYGTRRRVKALRG